MKWTLILISVLFFSVTLGHANTRCIHLGNIFSDVLHSLPAKRLLSPEYLAMHTKLHADRRLDCSNQGYKLTSSDSPYSRFDDELFKRMQSKNKDGQYAVFRIGDPSPPKIDHNLRHSFVNGHRLPLGGETETRKVLVSLYPGNIVNDLTSRRLHFSLKWFSPIIEAMLNPILSSARKKSAILNLWNAYTGIAVIGVDKGLDWVCHYGLVSPKIAFDQPFPLQDHIFPRLSEPGNAETLIQSAKVLGNTNQKFFEYLTGGGTQYYIPYLKRSSVNGEYSFISDLGSMVDRHGKSLPEYQLKSHTPSPPHWGVHSTKPCHLIDDQYDLAEINIHKRLWKEGYLDNDEFLEINSRLLELHEIQKPGEYYSITEYERIKEILENNKTHSIQLSPRS